MRLIILYFLLLLPFVQKMVPVKKQILPLEGKDQLMIFLQYEKDQHFIQSTLPQLKQYAQDRGIKLEERNALEGLPESITSTPAIIFQNHLGRNTYAARYASFSTLKNFIRTSRRSSSKVIDNCKTDIPTLISGRTKIGTSLKLTPLTGQTPKEFEAINFQQEATKAILAGLAQFRATKKTCFQKTDRLFYLDFHPYRDEQGHLFLSGAVYSQFNCILPIWSNFDQVKKTSYENFESTFSQLAYQMEEIVLQQLSASKNGDALSFIDASVPIKSWEALGFDLPPAPVDAIAISDAPFNWVEQWEFFGPVDEFTPVVQFRFPEPLERYAGEVTQLKGQLQLNKSHQLQSGKFEVATKSLTMGIADFDVKVHKDYIKVKKFPKASFSFGLLQNQPAIKANENTVMTVPGTFELMGKEIPVEVTAQINPVFSEADQSLLQVAATFQINITDDFKIKGPDGPSPANKTLVFNLNFLLTAK